MVSVSPTPQGMSQSQAYPVVPLMQPQALAHQLPALASTPHLAFSTEAMASAFKK